MKNKTLKIFALFAALFPAFVLAGCPQAHDDLLTLEKAFQQAKETYIQAEDGEPHGGVTNTGNKGSGTVGRCMNELNPKDDGNEHYFTITLPDAISSDKYIVKFRYASGNDNFSVKFTVNGGDKQTTGTGPGNGWDLGFSHDFVSSTGPVTLKAGDQLKVWTTDWGCIDYIKLEKPAN